MAENITDSLFGPLALKSQLEADFYVSSLYLMEPPALSSAEVKTESDNYGKVIEELHSFGCNFTTFLLENLRECAKKCSQEKQAFDLTLKCVGTDNNYMRFNGNGEEKETTPCGIDSFIKLLSKIFKLNPTKDDGCFIKLFMNAPEKGYIFGNCGIQTVFCDDPFSRDINQAISNASFSRVYGLMTIDHIAQGVRSEAMKNRAAHCINQVSEIAPKYTLLNINEFKNKYKNSLK